MTDALADSLSSDPGAWLVEIDMQHVFADPDSPWATPGFAGLLDTHRRLLAAFGERVVFTRFVAPETPSGAWVDYYRDWPFALMPADDPAYDIVAELPHGGLPVVSRTTFGKWDDKPESLREATGGAPTLVVAGVSTDCCVLSTVLAAADAGQRVMVVADGCAGVSPDDHERALSAMALYAPLVTVVSADDVLAGP